MSTTNAVSLKFPSGRPVSSAGEDAKKLANEMGITLVNAQNIVAQKNGIDLPWDANQTLTDSKFPQIAIQ